MQVMRFQRVTNTVWVTSGNVTPTVPPDAITFDNVLITGTTIGGEFGLHFGSTADGFTATGGLFTDAVFDLAIDYTVTVNDPAFAIAGTTIAAIGSRTGDTRLLFDVHIFETNRNLSCVCSSRHAGIFLSCVCHHRLPCGRTYLKHLHLSERLS
jgi:hypothetical protein